MSEYSTLEAAYYEWVKNPEPSVVSPHPQTVLDTNIDGQAWMYNAESESSEWLTYHGETKDLQQ